MTYDLDGFPSRILGKKIIRFHRLYHTVVSHYVSVKLANPSLKCVGFFLLNIILDIKVVKKEFFCLTIVEFVGFFL